MNKIELLGEEISYVVVHSSKANIPRIDISMNNIKVVLPEGSKKEPEDLLEENAISVLKKKKIFDKYRDQIPDREFKPGEKFLYLGKNRELAIKESAERVYVDGDYLFLPNLDVVDREERIKELLLDFYKRQAKKIMMPMIKEFSKRIDVEYNNVRFKNQKTRWGSSSLKKNLNFNWRLVMAPKKLIEYIVTHELIHLIEDNHSKKFWVKLANILPDYKERAKELKKLSPKMVFSEEDY